MLGKDYQAPPTQVRLRAGFPWWLGERGWGAEASRRDRGLSSLRASQARNPTENMYRISKKFRSGGPIAFGRTNRARSAIPAPDSQPMLPPHLHILTHTVEQPGNSASQQGARILRGRRLILVFRPQNSVACSPDPSPPAGSCHHDWQGTDNARWSVVDSPLVPAASSCTAISSTSHRIVSLFSNCGRVP